MSIPIEKLIKRMEWAAAHDLSKLSFTEDGNRVTILRDTARKAAAAHPSPPPAVDTTKSAAPDAATSGTVTAPLSGLCHLAAEANGAPFATSGQTAEAGQTLCMIEAMKVMTPVTAPLTGTVEAILVEDGSTVAAGTSLVRLS